MASTFRIYARTQLLLVPKATQGTRLFGLSKLVETSVVSIWSRSQSTSTTPQVPLERSSMIPEEEPGGPKLPFTDLKGIIHYNTLKAITVKPFKLTTMTTVQAAVLPLLPELINPHNPNPAEDDPPPAARDLLVKARTGTGKTLAFLVPAIEARLNAIEEAGKLAVRNAGLATDKHLASRARRVFSRTEVGTLIISPTRELATQIANEALRLAHHHDSFEVRLFTGGSSKRLQMRDWMKGQRDIVVATPGRLLDCLHSEPEVKHGISKTQILILDEADTLLDMGFRDDIEAIKEFLPPTPQRQTFLFSATVSRQIQQIARSILDKNHLFINTVSDKESPVHAHVPQYHTVLPSAAEQISHTLRLIAHDQLSNPGKSKIILFLATTKLTQLFSTLLRELSKTALPSLRDTHVYEIHSKRTQVSRMLTSDAFRNDKTGASILITSDVSARGVDYPGVTRVIQLGIPSGTEQYIHRVGRTGRAGTGGRGDLVLLPWEVGFLTWQLNGVPLKPVTSNELKAQLNTLAETYDADPAAAFKDNKRMTPSYNPRLDKNKPKMFAPGQQKILENIPAAVDNLLPSLDEEAIKETFASMLGYYMAKSAELRVQKGVIVQGCKDWTTEACGLPVPPYVSPGFLQRLGFPDGRTSRFGQSSYGYGYGYDRRGTPPPRSSDGYWADRGQQSFRGRSERRAPSWARSSQDADPDDPAGNPEEFRTSRYGSRAPREYSSRMEGRVPWGSRDDGGRGAGGGRDGGGSGDFRPRGDNKSREEFGGRDRSFGGSNSGYSGRRLREQDGSRFGSR